MKKKKLCDSDSECCKSPKVIKEKKVIKMTPKSGENVHVDAKSDKSAGFNSIDPGIDCNIWSVDSDIRELDFERALYRWYERNQEGNKKVDRLNVQSLTTDELMKKAKNLVKVVGGSNDLHRKITKGWISRWQERYGVPKRVDSCSDNTSTESVESVEPDEPKERPLCSEPIKQRLKKENLKTVEGKDGKIEEGIPVSESEEERRLEELLTVDTGQEQPTVQMTESVLKVQSDNQPPTDHIQYTNDQIYFAFCFKFNWTSLPDRSLYSREEDSVWLLMAGNCSGRHRMRILATGREWRPSCLKHVNMMSQPVVYAGGGNGEPTPDLFSWWFRKEFVPAADFLNAEYALIAEDKWLCSKLKERTDCRHVRLVGVSEKETSDWDLIYAEFKTRYALLLLKSLANMSETTTANFVTEYLKEFKLKDAFPLFHKSWLSIRSESFQRLTTNKYLISRKGKTYDSVIESVSHPSESDLMNLTKEETGQVKAEWDSVSKDGREGQRLVLTRRVNASSCHLQEDKILLLELQWLAHDVGLEVTDDDLSSWVLNRTPTQKETVKTEISRSNNLEEFESLPTASDAIECLNKALLWMETQPIDSSLLMTIRDIIDIARQASKMGLAPPHPGAALPFFCHNGDHLTQPPPAHMGIPPYQLDAKGAGAMGEYWRGLGLGGLNIRPSASGPPGSPVPPHPAISPQDWKRLGPLLAASGLSRTPMYPFSAGGTYPYPMLSPEMSQVPTSWHTPGMYPISAGAGFRSPYPTSLPISSTTLPSDFYRFSPTSLLPGHPGLSPHGHHSLSSHPAIVTPGPKQELGHHTQSDHNHRSSSLDHKNSSSSHHGRQESKTQDSGSQNDKKKPHIKKPLNAFMLYMKEMRAKVVAECTLKESAAINQILGRRWHALGREEQAKYYELARRERQLHMQLYPDWSSRANSSRGKKRKRKQEANDGGNNMKKCRARYGLDQQSQWCKPCRRKKKCIRYLESGEERDGNQSEDNLGSCGSVGEARTPPDDDDGAESLPHSLSSPGGLSGLSSLTSPSMILPSPSTSLASPSVSLASPCMSLQSPLTPPTFDMKPIMPIALPPLNRNPVGTNPHDVNNPLSVNQLTGKCIKSEPKEQSRPISVT